MFERLPIYVLLALVFTHVSAAAAVKSKSFCSARDLKRQDCRLVLGTYEIRLLSETVARNDGTWHTVDPMPLKGEGVVWEKVRLQVMQGRPILQLWLWDAGSGEAKVQALHWYVSDAKQGPLKLLAEGVVRRRRLKPAGGEDEAALAAAKKNPKFIYDAWEKHGLKILKDGSLEWHLGTEKKDLGKATSDGV